MWKVRLIYTKVYYPQNRYLYSYPLAGFNNIIKLVGSYTTGNASESHQTTMKYYSARVHLHGKGFLGFDKTELKDVTKGIVYENTMGYNSIYNNTYPVGQTVKTTGNSIISTTSLMNIVIPLGGKRIFPYVLSLTKTDNMTGLSETKTASNFDNYGNPRSVQTTKDLLIETQTISYTQKGSWCPNKPDSVTTVTTYDGQSETRKIKHFYDDVTGNLTKEIINPNSSEFKVITEYTYFDAFGHALTVDVKAKDANGVERTRTSSMTYTPEGTSVGRFVTSKTNVLGDTTTYDWDETRGLLNSETDQWGKTTSYTYDNWGNLKETRYPDGNRQTLVLQWAGNGAPVGAKYCSYEQTSGNSPVQTWYDALGREIQKDTYGLNNRKISVSTEYYTSGANKGRLYRVSEPYFEGEAKTWAETYSVYDPYGRPTTVATLMGNVTTVYSGLNTTVTTPESTKTTTLNNSGFVASSTVNGKTVSYAYFPSGLTKTATPQGGQALLMEYNLQGKRTKLTDPDAGVIETKYNGFGELVEEKQKIHSNNFLVTSHQFEPNTGRLNSINRNGEIKSYSYDPQNRVSSIEIDGQHKQTFSYDYFDRITNIMEEIDGRVYNRGSEYDALGRVRRVNYPSGDYIVNHYDQNGYMIKLTDQTGRNIWQILTENAKGQMLTEKKANIITTNVYDARGFLTSAVTPDIINMTYLFNTKGNLDYRIDHLAGQREDFLYEDQNRLFSWKINNSLTHTIGYNAVGNIQTKSDLGNYTMNYGENEKPHALTSITGVPANFPADSLSVTYTDFKKIKMLEEGDKFYEITYGVDDQRRKSVYKENNVTKKTTYYLGDYEEKTDHTSGITEKIHYLSGAIYIERSNGINNFYYAYTDYLGSLIALTDESGGVVEGYAYDPWGARRNPTDWTQTDSRTSRIVNRGYTGHEHLDVFGIINMNGRVYDPLTAQFFSPDPLVQAPENWLNYNRYLYAYGNPFKYTDPSGEFIVESIIIGAIMNGFMNGGLNWFYGGSFWDGFWKGAVVGGLSGAVGAGAGQLVNQALTIGGFAAGALTGAAGGAAGGFVSGAGNAWINGANYGEGIISGLKSAGIGAVVAGLMGGLSRGFTDLKNGFDFWDGGRNYEYSLGSLSKGATVSNLNNYNSSNVVLSNDEALQSRILYHYGYKTGDLNITKITTSAHIKNYGMNSTGDFVSLKSKELIGGYIRLYSSGFQSLHISPRIALGDVVDFKAVVGHELIHGYHNYFIPNNLRVFSERVAYKYTYDVYMNNGRYESAYTTFGISLQKGYLGTYPSNYQIPFYKFTPF